MHLCVIMKSVMIMDIYIDFRFIENKDAFFDTINDLLVCDVNDLEAFYHLLLHVKNMNIIFLYSSNMIFDDMFIKRIKKADRKNKKLRIIIEETERCY
ncbi:hypothetical protein SAMN05216514_1085 [Kandleria vitulina]|nr:hypothetical protein SAMN05216514_1085 [Kandleria vitulina]